MSKITANYETMYIINPTIDAEATAAIVEKFKAIVATNGTVTEVNEWGKRRLAYEIDKVRDGYYVLVEFNGPATLNAELERNYRISDEVMRFVVVKLPE